MGFNGQAQYWARDIDEACHILLRHYEHTYVAPGERFPAQGRDRDPIDRDVRLYPPTGRRWLRTGRRDLLRRNQSRTQEVVRYSQGHAGGDRIRIICRLERWSGMRSAETAVVWDAHLGGYPVCLIGIESKPSPRFGFVPADGPDQWTAGTLFPLSSKKVARAINAASNNRPVVILANLSGFDGSPESMRRLQLEYGAEIGRAVVNFKGPMVFCVISRYHGGAYVVFSRALNEKLEVAALEGTFASVIGGAPAAAVVFAGEVEARTRKDPRLQALTQALNQAMTKDDGVEKNRLRAEWDELFKVVHSEKLGGAGRASSTTSTACIGRLKWERSITFFRLPTFGRISLMRWKPALRERSKCAVVSSRARTQRRSLRPRLFWFRDGRVLAGAAEADVPPADDWLSASEAIRLKAFRFAKRRADWRLGRWTAKCAVAAALKLPDDSSSLRLIEITAAPTGEPEVTLVGSKRRRHHFDQPPGWYCHLRRRCRGKCKLGCDLEVIEARSDGFIADYFTTAEQDLIATRQQGRSRPAGFSTVEREGERVLKHCTLASGPTPGASR